MRQTTSRILPELCTIEHGKIKLSGVRAVEHFSPSCLEDEITWCCSGKTAFSHCKVHHYYSVWLIKVSIFTSFRSNKVTTKLFCTQSGACHLSNLNQPNTLFHFITKKKVDWFPQLRLSKWMINNSMTCKLYEQEKIK